MPLQEVARLLLEGAAGDAEYLATVEGKNKVEQRHMNLAVRAWFACRST